MCSSHAWLKYIDWPKTWRVQCCELLQYGTGQHASVKCLTFGSVKLTYLSDGSSEVRVSHLVLANQSLWVIEDTITRKYKVKHIHGHVFELLFSMITMFEIVSFMPVMETIAMYRPRNSIFPRPSLFYGPSWLYDLFSAGQLWCTEIPCSRWNGINENFHENICVHFNYYDTKTFLECDRFGVTNVIPSLFMGLIQFSPVMITSS